MGGRLFHEPFADRARLHTRRCLRLQAGLLAQPCRKIGGFFPFRKFLVGGQQVLGLLRAFARH